MAVATLVFSRYSCYKSGYLWPDKSINNKVLIFTPCGKQIVCCL